MSRELIERIDALIIETALSLVMHNTFIADFPSSNFESSLQTLRDCKAALSQPSVCTGTGLVYAIPDTHRVVPVDEITPEMWSAGRNEFCRIYDKVRYAMHSEIESAEIDAAPQSMMTAMLAAAKEKGE